MQEQARAGTIRAYVRVSTDEQAHEGFSLQTQRDEILRLVDYKWSGAGVVWYEDEGLSAKNTKRPALGRLRTECRPGDLVVCLRLDRLTRSVHDLYTLLLEWDQRGIRFRSVREDYDTSTASGKFMIGLLALLAQWERERISERVREVMQNVVAKEGRHVSKPPLGYDLTDKSLVVNVPEAALVRRVYAMYLAGKGTRAIAVSLNREGVRTKSGSEWTDFAVSYVLANPIYAGRVGWGRIVQHGKRRNTGRDNASSEGVVEAKGTHQAIIDENTWRAVQDRRALRHKPGRIPTGQHALSGVARCGLCGGSMHGFVQRRYRGGEPLPGQERPYYRCSNRNHKENCRLPYMAAAELEAKVLACLGALGDRATLLSVATEFLHDIEAGAAPGRMTELRAGLQRLDRRRHRVDWLYEDGEISKTEWREKAAEIRRQQASMRAELEALAPRVPEIVDAADVADALGDLPLVWRTLAPEERKVVMQGLVARVIVHQDGSVTVIPRGANVPG